MHITKRHEAAFRDMLFLAIIIVGEMLLSGADGRELRIVDWTHAPRNVRCESLYTIFTKWYNLIGGTRFWHDASANTEAAHGYHTRIAMIAGRSSQDKGMSIAADAVAKGRALHARLLAADPTAPADLAVAYLESLEDWLSRHNPRADPDACATAAEDAILALIKNPASYRPERQALEVYLRLSSAGDLKNLLRAEQRHSRRRADLHAVELSPVAGKYLQDVEADPARVMERREIEERWARAEPPIPATVQDRLTPEEAAVMRLMRQHERRTAIYAAVLGLTDRPAAEQRRAVKRVKDRLTKRLERAGGDDE